MVQGRGQFVADLCLPGMLHARFVRSPHAHARILRVRRESALATPGVVACYTASDLVGVKPLGTGEAFPPDYRVPLQPPLAGGRALFTGEAVAVVLAEDPYAAADGVAAVEVDYEPLSALLDPEASLGGEPLLHPQLGTNVFFRYEHRWGDVEGAFRKAHLVVSGVFNIPRAAPAPLEPRALLAHYDTSSGVLTVHASTQIPSILQTALSRLLSLPEGRVRVVTPDVGGGFGLKATVYPEEVVVAWASLQTGRPVQWVDDRVSDISASTQGRGRRVWAELALRRDGTFLALRVWDLSEAGAYSSYPLTCALEPLSSFVLFPGPYRWQAYHFTTRAVATNRCPAGAYRGVGFATAAFVTERLVDMAARRLGVDPVELRRANLVRAFPHRNPAGAIYDSGNFEGLLDKALARLGYGWWRRRQRRGRGPRLGIGVALFLESTGQGRAVYHSRGTTHVPAFDSARLRMEPSGAVRAWVSTACQGQDHAGTLTLLVARELGVDPSRVEVRWGDTAEAPYGLGTFASRTVVGSGSALVLAARELRERLLRIASFLTEVPRERLYLASGAVCVRGEGKPLLPLEEVAYAAYTARAFAAGVEPGLEVLRAVDPTAVFGSACHACAVEVDPDTGEVRVLRYVVAEDCGTMVNPRAVREQTLGAVAQALENALYSACLYSDEGQPLNSTFMDYPLLRAPDMPPIEVVHQETPSPYTPTGAKGVGESGSVGAAAALANAVADALGEEQAGRVLSIPLAGEPLWQLLQ